MVAPTVPHSSFVIPHSKVSYFIWGKNANPHPQMVHPIQVLQLPFFGLECWGDLYDLCTPRTLNLLGRGDRIGDRDADRGTLLSADTQHRVVLPYQPLGRGGSVLGCRVFSTLSLYLPNCSTGLSGLSADLCVRILSGAC